MWGLPAPAAKGCGAMCQSGGSKILTQTLGLARTGAPPGGAAADAGSLHGGYGFGKRFLDNP
jgi:hypothetical protein